MEELNLIKVAIEVTKKVTNKNFGLFHFQECDNIAVVHTFVLSFRDTRINFAISQVRNYEKKLWLLVNNDTATIFKDAFEEAGIKPF